LIRQKSKWGRLLRRSEFITLQNRYFQVYSQFYGLTSLIQLRVQNLHFRRSATSRHSKLSLALTHFNQQLDVSLCHLRLAPTLQIARLLIHQGYIRVNGAQVWTPRKRVQV
jgi:ribosomal protein S4